jgi:hypothetical protein
MQIYINDLDGRTRTLDVDHETTAADVCRGGRLLHNGSFITGTLRDANVQRDATLTVVDCLRGGMPEREYNSSDEDSVTTDSNEGKEEEEDSSDYESSDDETTLPQVTTLESVLAMIPFTPDWREAASKVNSCFNLRCYSLDTVAWVGGRVRVRGSLVACHAGGRRAPRTRPCTTGGRWSPRRTGPSTWSNCARRACTPTLSESNYMIQRKISRTSTTSRTR